MLMTAGVVFLLFIAFLALFFVMIIGNKLFHYIQEQQDEEDRSKNIHS